MISYKLFIILNIIFLKFYFAFIVENRVEMTEWSGRARGGPRAGIRTQDACISNIFN